MFVLLCPVVWDHEIAEDIRLEDRNVTNILELRTIKAFTPGLVFHGVQPLPFFLWGKIATAVNLTLFTDSLTLQLFQTITVPLVSNFRLFSNRAALDEFILNYVK